MSEMEATKLRFLPGRFALHELHFRKPAGLHHFFYEPRG